MTSSQLKVECLVSSLEPFALENCFLTQKFICAVNVIYELYVIDIENIRFS